VVGVIALLAVGVVGVVVLNRLGGDSPRGAVEEYIDALRDGNVDRMREVTCADMQADLDNFELFLDGEFGDELRRTEIEILNVREDGDEARVTVRTTLTLGGETETSTDDVLVVKEDGDWKVCS
jgi:hypothetical protein